MANLSICLEEIQIYVGAYRKYNEGSIFGKWLKLSDYSDYRALLDAMRQLHRDEADPEFMIQDFEAPAIFERSGLISEAGISERIYEAVEIVECSGYPAEVWDAFTDCFGIYADLGQICADIQERYAGEYSSEEDFAESLLSETGCLPTLPPYIHIDWERTARDLMVDYTSSGRHYFRCF